MPIHREIPQSHLTADAARIEVIIANHDPLDLIDFTASLTAMAREHESRLKASNPKIDIDETRLLIVDIRKGSVVLELLPILAPIISTAEVTNTAVAFVEHLGRAFSILQKPKGRIENPTTAQLKNMSDAVQVIANDSAGQLKIAAKYQNGQVIQEFIVTKAEAMQIAQNAYDQRKEIEKKESAEFKMVLMRLHQTSADSLKIDKRTSEKGIVERIDGTPRTLIYASDLAGQRIKSEILQADGNPFQKGFIVDLDVETVNGSPRVYRIVEVHDVIDLDDEEQGM